jgi:hypothetical protein
VSSPLANLPTLGVLVCALLLSLGGIIRGLAKLCHELKPILLLRTLERVMGKEKLGQASACDLARAVQLDDLPEKKTPPALPPRPVDRDPPPTVDTRE